MFEPKFAFSLGVFCSYAAFFSIFGSNFFLNGFSDPFTAHSRPSFLFELNFHFLLVVFFVHMRHFDIDLLFFFFFI